jgi:crossover junction endodeoxyribonuclease RuvC
VRVLGLDPGSRRTGFGIVERRGNAYRAVDFGLIVPPPRLDLARRLGVIAERAGALIAEHAPDCVVVEEAFYHQSVRSTLVLGHVRGALLVAATARGVDVAEYTPRAVKLAVTGTGAASKEQVSFMVRRLLPVRGMLAPDVSDALALALCHLHRARATAPQRAVSAAAARLATLLARRESGRS